MKAIDGNGRIVVIGGGIAGLAATHAVVEQARGSSLAPSVLLLEGSERLGGQVRTERDGSFLFEGGADTLVTKKPAGVELCERIGLGAELEELDARRTGAQVVHRGRLVSVPDGFFMMAPTRWRSALASPLFSWHGKLRMLCEPFVPARPPDRDDESVASFVTRRFGREILDRVAEPIIAGLYTADADRLSLRATMPAFLDFERKHGSVIRGLEAAARMRSERGRARRRERGAFVFLRGGLGRIVYTLASRIPADAIRTRARVVSVVRREPADGWRVVLEDGDALTACAVVLACPAFESATLLRETDRALSDELGRLRYASCATVTLVYRRVDVARLPASFGFFVPRTENLPLLACSHVSEKFSGRAPAEAVVFRAFVGGAARPETFDGDDVTLVRRVHDALRSLMGIRGEPALTRTFRFPRAMPQFDVGARSWLDDIRRRARRHSGLLLAGSSAGAIGLPDCIRSGEEAAEAAASGMTDHSGLRGTATRATT